MTCDANKAQALAVLDAGGSISEAARVAGVARSTIRSWFGARGGEPPPGDEPQDEVAPAAGPPPGDSDSQHPGAPPAEQADAAPALPAEDVPTEPPPPPPAPAWQLDDRPGYAGVMVENWGSSLAVELRLWCPAGEDGATAAAMGAQRLAREAVAVRVSEGIRRGRHFGVYCDRRRLVATLRADLARLAGRIGEARRQKSERLLAAWLTDEQTLEHARRSFALEQMEQQHGQLTAAVAEGERLLRDAGERALDEARSIAAGARAEAGAALLRQRDEARRAVAAAVAGLLDGLCVVEQAQLLLPAPQDVDVEGELGRLALAAEAEGAGHAVP